MRPSVLAPALALLALAAARAASPAPHPVYQRLKAFRSYFQVNEVEPMAHRFTAWFIARGYCRSDLGGNTPEDFAALPDGELGVSTGAFALPPSSVEPVPEEVAHLAEAFEARLREAYPEMHDLKLSYAGERRVLRVHEVTPLSAGGPAEERFGRRSYLSLAHAPGSTLLEDWGPFQAFGGLGRLVPYGQEAELPRFVPYVLPPELEGTALGYARASEPGPRHAAAWEALEEALLATADALEAGSYQNPIEEVLAAQGEGLLPPGFAPVLRYRFDVYARAEDFQDQVDDRREPGFPLQAAAAGPVVVEETSAVTGLRYRFELDLALGVLAIKVETAAGEAWKGEFSVEGELLRDEAGGGVAAQHAYLKVPVGEDDDASLPGTGGFTSFDLYPDSLLLTRSIREEPGGEG